MDENIGNNNGDAVVPIGLGLRMETSLSEGNKEDGDRLRDGKDMNTTLRYKLKDQYITPSPLTPNNRRMSSGDIPSSPASLLHVIMKHVFKTSKNSSYLPELEGKVRSGSYSSINFPDAPHLSSPKLSLQKHFDIMGTPVQLINGMQRRPSKIDIYSPARTQLQSQDFLYDILQHSEDLAKFLYTDEEGYSPIYLHNFPYDDEDDPFYPDTKSANQETTIKEKLTCRFCKKEFSKRFNRDRHMAMQSCKRFEGTRNLKSTERGWVCNLCPTAIFQSKKAAMAHKSVHNIDEKKCPVCHDNLNHLSPRNVLQHVKENHPEFLQ